MTLKGFGQTDPIFTQYMFNMQLINPAYAGIWDKTGFNSLVRVQWVGINKSPLTQVLSLHTATKNKNVGLGLNISNDRYVHENRLSIFGDYAYEIQVSPKTRVRLGLKYGFFNYKNSLTQYKLYPNSQFDPAFAEDVDLKFLPNFGIGAFLYKENYYFSLSLPKLLINNLGANIYNYATLTQTRPIYFSAGYYYQFITLSDLVVKPTFMVKALRNTPLQFDFGINFLLYDHLWLGAMYRSGDALCFISQLTLKKKYKFGIALDIAWSDMFPHQFGTYEFTFGFDVDFYGRSYLRNKYF